LATTETEHEVESGLFLNVVILKSSSLLKLFAGENQTLLIGRDAFLVLDLGLDVIDCVKRCSNYRRRTRLEKVLEQTTTIFTWRKDDESITKVRTKTQRTKK